MPSTLLFILCGIIAIPYANAQASFAIEPAGVPRAEIVRTVANGLEPDGTRLLRLVNGLRILLAEIWWTDRVATHGRRHTRSDVAYGNLVTGGLLGVLYLPKPAEDFNRHQIQVGAYTMRYIQMPRKKNDREEDRSDAEEERANALASRYRDFVLLSKIDSAAQTEDRYGFARVAKLSGKLSADSELLALVPVNPLYKGFPAIVSDDQGHCVVQFKLHSGASRGGRGGLEIAIVLVNPPNVSLED